MKPTSFLNQFLLAVCLVILLGLVKTTGVMAQPAPDDKSSVSQDVRKTTQPENQAQVEDQAPAETNDQLQVQDQQMPEYTVEQTQQILEQVEEKTQAYSRLAVIRVFRLEKRFSFYYHRLTKIADKLESRLQVMTDEGINVSEAQQTLTNALLLLEEAMEQSNSAIAGLKAVVLEDYQTQEQITFQAKDEAEQSRQLYSQALQELRQAVQVAMKQVR